MPGAMVIRSTGRQDRESRPSHAAWPAGSVCKCSIRARRTARSRSAALEQGVDLHDATACAAIANGHAIAVEGGVTTLDGRDVSAEIRGPEVTAAVSAVSAHPGVRLVLVAHQRAWVREHGAGVVEGRDIGTVVFPGARLKVFLTASDEERAAASTRRGRVSV